MGTRIRGIICFFFVFSVLSFFAGCGSTGGQSELKSYKVEYASFGGGSNISINSLKLINGIVYFIETDDQGKSNIYRFSPKFNNRNCIIGPDSEENPQNLNMALCFGKTDEGGLGVVESDFSSLSLLKFDKHHVMTEKEELSADLSLGGTDSYPYAVVFGKDRYAMINGDILSFAGNKQTGRASLGDGVRVNNIVCAGERIFVFGDSAHGIKEFDIEKNVLKDIDSFSGKPVMGISESGADDFFFVYDDSELYRYYVKSGKKESVLQWSDYDIMGNAIYAVEEYEGAIYCVTYDPGVGGEAIILTEKDPADTTPDPVTINIATLWYGPSLSDAVGAYNKEHPESRVRVKEYMSDSVTIGKNEDVDWLMRDIIGRGNLDIIDLSGFEFGSPSYLDMIEKGYLVDLTDYFNKSKKISVDDFIESTASIYRKDDFLAAIPIAFGIETYIADSEVFPDETVTIPEIIEYDLAHPGRRIQESSPAGALKICVHDDIEYYVDLENGTCDFTSDDFRRALEYAKTYAGPGASEAMIEGPAVDSFGRKRFIHNYRIDKIDNYMWDRENYYDGKVNVCGIPSMDGTYRTIVFSSNGSALGILGNSKNKELAWDFIEYYLNRNYTVVKYDTLSSYGLPSRKVDFEEYLNLLSEKDGPMKEREIEFSRFDETTLIRQHPLTREEREMIVHYLDHAVPQSPRYAPIKEIIGEEVEAYFAGQKSLDEVIGIIQNRVQNYLDEKK